MQENVKARWSVGPELLQLWADGCKTHTGTDGAQTFNTERPGKAGNQTYNPLRQKQLLCVHNFPVRAGDVDASKHSTQKKDYSIVAPAPSATWSAVIHVLRKSLIQLCYFCSPLAKKSSGFLTAYATC